MLTAHPDINVIMGADQAITGALQAVTTAGKKGKVSSSATAAAPWPSRASPRAIVSGPSCSCPQPRAAWASTNLIQAIRTGTPAAGVDVLANLPNGGVVTKDKSQSS